MRWGSFPTTADVGIWASAPTSAGLLEGLGRALYALLADPRKVRPREERVVTARGRDAGELVVAYLGELLALQDAEGFLARSVSIELSETEPPSVVARLRGERFDPARHTARTEVKAVTYHDLVFDPERGRARVIVDI